MGCNRSHQWILLGFMLLSTGVWAQASYVERMSEIDAEMRLLARENELTAMRRAASQTVELPTVLAINGFGKEVSAQILYPNGVQRQVAVGDRLADGVTIRSVEARGVTVRANGRDVLLQSHSPQDETAARFDDQRAFAPLPELPPVRSPGMAPGVRQ